MPDLLDIQRANHFLIGLGGTGGHVLREFRRRLYEPGMALGRVAPDDDTESPGFVLRYRDEDQLDRDLRIPGRIHALQRFDEDAGGRVIREVEGELVQLDRRRKEQTRDWLVEHQTELKAAAGAQYEADVLPILKAAIETVRTS